MSRLGMMLGTVALSACASIMHGTSQDQLQATLAAQKTSVAPTKDGICVVPVKHAPPEWMKVGQLQRMSPALGH